MERLQWVFSGSYSGKFEPGRRKINVFAGTVLCCSRLCPEGVSPARGGPHQHYPTAFLGQGGKSSCQYLPAEPRSKGQGRGVRLRTPGTTSKSIAQQLDSISLEIQQVTLTNACDLKADFSSAQQPALPKAQALLNSLCLPGLGEKQRL